MHKFSPIDLEGYFDLAPEAMTSPWHPELVPRVNALPDGPQTFWGIPFLLAKAGSHRWLELRGQAAVTLPMVGRADYVVLAHFCNASLDPETKQRWPDIGLGDGFRIGEKLADYVLVCADGSEHRQRIRRRFEVSEPFRSEWPFVARPHSGYRPVDWRGPYARNGWGSAQTGTAGPERLYYWIYALPNPHADSQLAALRLEATGADCLAIAGVTLYCGEAHPLQYQRLAPFRVLLPTEESALPEQVHAEVDLGIVARKYAVPAFDSQHWCAEELQGWGDKGQEPWPTNDLRLEMTASPDATLMINTHAIDLSPVYATGTGASHDGAVHIELLDRQTTWVHVVVEDGATGEATPARVHFRSEDGRYLPPYGHRHEVNDNWFEDYGADLKLGATEFAYVDGRFQIELPVGNVYVEAVKGFEYSPLRQQVQIKPGQRELRLKLQRPFDLRSRGWVTADTHVHFLSPQTAWLEARAEGVNLVNLLASQWGDLFTNIGDLTGGLSGVSANDTLVWVGTENRQHLLGHISLLGGKGQPAYPLTTDGPPESRLGDPIESSLAEWADRCRQREGVVIMPHFPYPHLEAAADIILGKVDGVEIRSFSPALDNYPMSEWYRFLNLGYRVAAVGGTDKMSAGMPLGGVRTYAYLGDDELTFANWARAVRAGRTFTTSGPLIGLLVEGHAPGDEVQMPAGGGTLDVEAWADSVQPIHELQLVVNGKVTERVVAQAGSRHLRLHVNVHLAGSGWLAARCVSRLIVWHVWPINVAAHTSPVYVVSGGAELFSPSDATFMLTLLDGGLAYLDTLSIPAGRQRHDQIKAVFREAQNRLHTRMHARGCHHEH